MNFDQDDIYDAYSATVISSERITPPDAAEVRHLVLRLPEGEFTFSEGQCVAVLVPGPHEFGNAYHVRLYSIASSRAGEGGEPGDISICVRRCFSIDPISGEQFPGKASNYLCDAKVHDSILLAGPYGAHFSIPSDPNCNLLMVGAGTGIAPFRSFVKRIYSELGGWQGKVRLFYGARTGTEMLYMNDVKKDLDLYYDEKTFRAFEAVSPRPHFDEPPALDQILADNAREVWEMIQEPNTHVYVAGQFDAEQKFAKAMSEMAGSESAWRHKRQEMLRQDRYAELLHE
jgi:ferredoxin--NADP+ reductase